MTAGVCEPRPRPTTVAALEPRPIDEAFSALTGIPREPNATALLGYAPTVPLDEARTTTTVARDRTASIKLAALSPGDLTPEPARPTRNVAQPVAKVAPKADRGDPSARLVSRVTDRLDPRMLDRDSQRSPSMAQLMHPDQESVAQLVVKPTQMLADGFNRGVSGPVTGRFDGPSVVALSVVQMP